MVVLSDIDIDRENIVQKVNNNVLEIKPFIISRLDVECLGDIKGLKEGASDGTRLLLFLLNFIILLAR